jgi:hypothetical protein
LTREGFEHSAKINEKEQPGDHRFFSFRPVALRHRLSAVLPWLDIK